MRGRAALLVARRVALLATWLVARDRKTFQGALQLASARAGDRVVRRVRRAGGQPPTVLDATVGDVLSQEGSLFERAAF